MTVIEAAQKLGLRPWTIRDKARKSLLAPASKINGDWDISERAVESYRAQQRYDGANAATKRLIRRGVAR